MHFWSLILRREGERVGSLFTEIMAENFLNIRRDLDIQVYEDVTPKFQPQMIFFSPVTIVSFLRMLYK